MKLSSPVKSLGTKLWQLLLACLAIGLILSLFGVKPIDIIVFLLKVKRAVMDMGWGVFGYLLEILLMGALIVIPILVIITVFKFLVTQWQQRRGKRNEP